MAGKPTLRRYRRVYARLKDRLMRLATRRAARPNLNSGLEKVVL
jgi:hypothetical protein